MSKVWEKFDMEIAATPNPEPYQNKVVKLQNFQSSFIIEHISWSYVVVVNMIS